MTSPSSPKKKPASIVVDANEAAASVAYRMSEVITLFPITPSSPMGEKSDAWAAAGKPNLWGNVPRVVSMQSEAGAAGAMHGAAQEGALATTFTASQGLLLMIPDMFKIAGELTAFCMHVAARAVATHALSIFGDHSDVMAVRSAGFALLCSSSVQEAGDMAAIAHAATLRARVPLLHFFDGFRTSHEIQKIDAIDDETLRALVDEEALAAHRARALDPDHPVIRGTSHNPDTFFQAREACNPWYDACAGIVRETMNRFAELTGRAYAPFEYAGDPEADRVLVMMGSACETAEEAIDWLRARGERVGVVKVRLYRPFDAEAFRAALPRTARAIAVLDRTKEPGALGEPLHLDVALALSRERQGLRIVGGRYGLSSKELTPAMLVSVFEELRKDEPRDRFTVGIVDDVTRTSLPWDRSLDLEPRDVTRAVFFGIGSDGTVGANKQAISILGDATDLYSQAYFVYDSKKAGTMTVSHLRLSPRPIRSAYLIRRAGFVACSAPEILQRTDVLELADTGATVLLNLPGEPEEAWDRLPAEVQDAIIGKELRVFVVDGSRIATEVGLEGRLGTILEAGFFELTDLIAKEEALARLEGAMKKAYGKRGPEVVAKNVAAITRAAASLRLLPIPKDRRRGRPRPEIVDPRAPDFVRRVTAMMLAGKGDDLPVSAFPPDGTWPVGTASWEKRHLAKEVPEWLVDACIQCHKCVLSCPHVALRAKVLEPSEAPTGLVTMDYRGKEYGAGLRYALAVSPDDCTGCGLCVEACPVDKDGNKPLAMRALSGDLEHRERAAFEAVSKARALDRRKLRLDVKGTQLLEPYFEFPGACSGCGETPYLKVVSQLFGDRAVVANATGCSSIYGGNLPTTPWRTDCEGRGPAWSNSLFEDNAEFGLGIRLGLDARRDEAARLLRELAGHVGDDLVTALVQDRSRDEAGIAAQRERVAALRDKLRGSDDRRAHHLDALADALVRRSVWIVGGDGWAYDIGFGGLDHVLASGHDVNILVMDTEVYSNTGGQRSKATPLGAVAKFAAGGKESAKKDLGLIAITYGCAYVASVAVGAKDAQAVKAIAEAESFDGPSLVIAYSPCVEHGYDLAHGFDHQKHAFEAGIWPIYRYDPRRDPPMQLETPAKPASVEAFLRSEDRFLAVQRRDPERFASIVKSAEETVTRRRALFERLAR